MERNLLVFFVLFLSFFASSCSAYFSGEALAAAPAGGARVYIVIVKWHKGLETEDFAIRTLTSVLGSEVAAKKALVYVYGIAVPNFAAKLTPIEAFKLKEQPGILEVVPDSPYHMLPIY